METIVFTFGRMNPPTIGHSKLISTLVETAKIHNADHIVFLSQTNNNKTDPLEWNFKRRVCESAFPGVNISKDISVKNPYIALEKLSEQYNNIMMVVGSDREQEFKKCFNPYAKKWDIGFSVISAGDRLDESSGVEGISATKMRQYARNGNKEEFFSWLPDSLNKNIKSLVYANVRKGFK